jgi:hypothetical protein
MLVASGLGGSGSSFSHAATNMRMVANIRTHIDSKETTLFMILPGLISVNELLWDSILIEGIPYGHTS